MSSREMPSVDSTSDVLSSEKAVWEDVRASLIMLRRDVRFEVSTAMVAMVVVVKSSCVSVVNSRCNGLATKKFSFGLLSIRRGSTQPNDYLERSNP